MNRRSFMGLLGIAPVALKAAPVDASPFPFMPSAISPFPASIVTEGISIRYAPRGITPKIGDTIIVRKPIRFFAKKSYDFNNRADEFVMTTIATPEDLAAYHAANRVESRQRTEYINGLG